MVINGTPLTCTSQTQPHIASSAFQLITTTTCVIHSRLSHWVPGHRTARPLVKSVDRCNILCVEREIERPEVLLDSVCRCLGKGHIAFLQRPANQNQCGSLSVLQAIQVRPSEKIYGCIHHLFCDFDHNRIFDPFSLFGLGSTNQWRVRLHNDPLRLAVRHNRSLLTPRVELSTQCHSVRIPGEITSHLDLVHGRFF